jgi:membrane fusion protein, copper/silver efflux system
MPNRKALIVSLCLAAVIFAVGYTAHRQSVPAASPFPLAQVVSYTCPMHPQYTSDHPGDCPICGMRLVRADLDRSKTDASTADRPGMVRISTAKQQLIGVHTDEVKRAPASHELRVPGRIAVDEQRAYRVIAAVDGWIRQLGPNPAGSFVKKNQVLASYYAQNLISATQTYVFAQQTNAQAQSGDATIGYQRGATTLSLQVALDSLRALGMSEYQIHEIERTRVAPTEIRVYSPISGFVITRNVSPEQRFDKGTEMYRIADISHVWVMTDIFEKDREFLRPDRLATVDYRGRKLPARMSDALPQFDPQSRTLKTRFELDNSGYILRPDMFVDIELHVEMPSAITVPADAVIDSGREKVVFVERSEGMFEPRVVETGWRLADRIEVTSGLEPGEKVVVAGNFLIDSESRMKLAGVDRISTAEKTSQKDPVCSMKVAPKDQQAIIVEHDGKTWYFCSEGCKKTFQANPERYAPKKVSAQDAHPERGPA